MVIWEFLSSMWRLFYGSEGHSLLTPFSKESMKVKKYQISTCYMHVPRWYMCPARNKKWIDINRWTPLVHKKMCPFIRGVHCFKSWWILVLFSKIYHFYTYISGSQCKWKMLVSLWTKKRKKEMMLNCSNLKCFKMEYVPVKPIIQTLF